MERKIGNRLFNFSKRTYIMGILNITHDSFSDGDQFFDKDLAVSHAGEMSNDGADIIDIGGESTRPGSNPVNVEEEKERVVPTIKAISKIIDIPISIDTSKPEVAAEAINAGAVMVNDVTGLRNPKMLEYVANKNIPTIIMHMQGEPRIMQEDPKYDDVVNDIYRYLEKQANDAINAGLSSENIYIDFGIGFGKTLEDNLKLIRRMSEFKKMGYPVVYGPSRKSFIGNILNLPANQRLEGTSAAVCAGVMSGADIVRVHDVKEMKRVIGVTERIMGR